MCLYIPAGIQYNSSRNAPADFRSSKVGVISGRAEPLYESIPEQDYSPCGGGPGHTYAVLERPPLYESHDVPHYQVQEVSSEKW